MAMHRLAQSDGREQRERKSRGLVSPTPWRRRMNAKVPNLGKSIAANQPSPDGMAVKKSAESAEVPTIMSRRSLGEGGWKIFDRETRE